MTTVQGMVPYSIQLVFSLIPVFLCLMCPSVAIYDPPNDNDESVTSVITSSSFISVDVPLLTSEYTVMVTSSSGENMFGLMVSSTLISSEDSLVFTMSTTSLEDVMQQTIQEMITPSPTLMFQSSSSLLEFEMSSLMPVSSSHEFQIPTQGDLNSSETSSMRILISISSFSQELEISLEPVSSPSLGVLMSTLGVSSMTSSPMISISSSSLVEFETSSLRPIFISSPSQGVSISTQGVLVSSPLQEFEVSSQGLETSYISPSQRFLISPSPGISISPSQGVLISTQGVLVSSTSQAFKTSSLELELETSYLSPSQGVLIVPSPGVPISSLQGVLISSFFTQMISSSFPPLSVSRTMPISPSPTPTTITVREDVTLYIRFVSLGRLLRSFIENEINSVQIVNITSAMCAVVPSKASLYVRMECIVSMELPMTAITISDAYFAIIDAITSSDRRLLMSGTNISSLRGFCDFEKVSDNRGNYSWEEIEVGSTAVNLCSFGPPDTNTTRFCNSPRNWNDSMADDCFTVVTETFSNLNNSLQDQILNLSIETFQLFSSTLSSLSRNASNIIDQNSININVVLNIVKAAGQFFTINRTIDSQNSIIEIMDNFIQTYEAIETWPESSIQGTGSDLTLSLNELANGLALQSDVEGFDIFGDSISLRIVKPNSSQVVTFVAETTDQMVSSSIINGRVDIVGNTSRRGAIALNTTLNTSYYLINYRTNSSFFLSDNDIVSSIIMDLSTTRQSESNVITVNITFSLQNITSALTSSVDCVFWDRTSNQGLGDWSSEGCITTNNTGYHVSCQCNHLTAFAAILNSSRNDSFTITSLPTVSSSLAVFVSPTVSVSPTITDDVMNPRLVIVSCVGIAVCMGLLFVTIITLLIFKPVRTKSSSVFHCQLSLAMFCLQSVLIVGVNSTENVTGCVVVAVLLHYFILTSLMWFFAEMAHLLVKTYFVFYKSSYKYLAILSMFCWGIPIPVVAVTVAFSTSAYINETDGYCFISKFDVFLATVLIPVGVLLIVNLLMYILILNKLMMYQQAQHGHGKSVYSKKTIIKDTTAIIGLIILFISSAALIIVHFVGIIQQSFIQMVFASVCIILGVYLFCFFVLASNEARNGWKALFKKIRCKSITRRTYGYDVQNLQHGGDGGLGLRHRLRPHEMSTVTVLSSNSLDEVIHNNPSTSTPAPGYEVDNNTVVTTAASRYIVSRHLASDAIQPMANTPDYHIEVTGEVENDVSSRRVIQTTQVVDSDDFVVLTPLGLPLPQEDKPADDSSTIISTADVIIYNNKYSTEDSTDEDD